MNVQQLVRTVIFLAALGLLFVYAQRFGSKLASKAGV